MQLGQDVFHTSTGVGKTENEDEIEALIGQTRLSSTGQDGLDVAHAFLFDLLLNPRHCQWTDV